MTDHLLHYTPSWWLCTQTSTHSTLSTSSQGCVHKHVCCTFSISSQGCVHKQICSTLCTSSQGYVHKHLCCTLGTSSQGRVHKLYKICVKHLHTIHSVPPHRDVYTNIYTQYTRYLLTGMCTQTSTHNTLGTSSQGCAHKHKCCTSSRCTLSTSLQVGCTQTSTHSTLIPPHREMCTHYTLGDVCINIYTHTPVHAVPPCGVERMFSSTSRQENAKI